MARVTPLRHLDDTFGLEAPGSRGGKWGKRALCPSLQRAFARAARARAQAPAPTAIASIRVVERLTQC
jgi:hypothetical protein